MDTVKTTHSLLITGEEAISFLESLISIDPVNEKFMTSFLLKPDGKVAHWFIVQKTGEDFYIFQSKEELVSIKESLEFYKIRTKCTLEIKKDERSLLLDIKNDGFEFFEKVDIDKFISWRQLSVILELPLPEITAKGLLPNETKWLNFMVDFNKGCFLGQEQASRVKFRGRPRRLLKSNEDSQEFVKI